MSSTAAPDASNYIKTRKQRAGSIASLYTVHRADCKRISALAFRYSVSASDLRQPVQFCKVCMKSECAALV